MRFARVICFLSALGPVGALAESAIPGAASVGRLMLKGAAMCTGALVAPDLVLTAAHCLYDPRSGKRMHPKDMEFQAGVARGKASAVRGVTSATAHPDYVHRSKGQAQVGYDLALLRLTQPIDGVSLPMAQDAQLGSGDMLGVVAYTIGHKNAPFLEYPCRVMTRQGETLVMSCDVNYGASGAPVVALRNGATPSVVSVVSARAAMGGQQVSIGTTLTAKALQAMLRGG